MQPCSTAVAHRALKKMRSTPAALALLATLANVDAHNAATYNVSSGSEIQSVTSSTERHRRAQLARAQLELAEARVNMAQAELDLTTGSRAGSVGRLTDVRSEDGASTTARQRSSAEMAVPLIQLDTELPLGTTMLSTLRESKEEHCSPNEGDGLISQGHFALEEASVQGRVAPKEASGPGHFAPKEASDQSHFAPRGGCSF